MQERLHLKGSALEDQRRRAERQLADVERQIVSLKKAVRRNTIRKHEKLGKLRAVARAWREVLAKRTM